MRAALIASLVALSLCFAGGAAHAQRCPDTCTVGSTAYACDMLCSVGVACNSSAATDGCPAKCKNNMGQIQPGSPECHVDGDCTTAPYTLCDFAGDGLKTLCGTSTGDTMNGTNADEVFCGNGGNDVIDAKSGDDRINGGAGDDTIDAGGGADIVVGDTGADNILGGAGNDNINGQGVGGSPFTGDSGNVIDGGTNDDAIVGADGDDVIFGNDGSDVIVGQGGRDFLSGDNNNDTIVSNYGGAVTNDVLGTLLCGGAGDDFIWGDGPGHQCIDAGTGQVVTGSEVDCSYSNYPDDTDACDVATTRNCLNPSKLSTNGTLLSRAAPCGCD